MYNMFPFFSVGYGGLAFLVLRIALAAVVIAHGWPKVSDLKKNSENFNHMGFRPGSFWGTIAALLEFFGGIALLFGVFTGIIAFLFAVEFAVILVWRIAKGHAFIGGWELDLLLFALFLFFVSMSGGVSWHVVASGRMMRGY